MKKMKYLGVGVAVLMVLLSMAVVSSALKTEKIIEDEDDFFPRNVPNTTMEELYELTRNIHTVYDIGGTYNHEVWATSHVPSDEGFEDWENEESTYYNDWYWQTHYEEWNVVMRTG